MSTAPPTKRCTRCGQDKPATVAEFTRHPRTAPQPNGDRLGIYCAECRRALRRSRRSRRHPRVDVADLVPPPAPPVPEPAAPVEGLSAREPQTPAVTTVPDPAEALVPAPTLMRLSAILQAGAMIDDAARACGLDPAEVVTWLARGDGDDAESPYAAFRHRVLSATSTAAVRFAAIISRAAETDWKASAWWLEHGPASSRWGRDVGARLGEPQAGPPDPGDPFAEVDELAARRARQGPTPSPGGPPP